MERGEERKQEETIKERWRTGKRGWKREGNKEKREMNEGERK